MKGEEPNLIMAIRFYFRWKNKYVKHYASLGKQYLKEKTCGVKRDSKPCLIHILGGALGISYPESAVNNQTGDSFRALRNAVRPKNFAGSQIHQFNVILFISKPWRYAAARSSSPFKNQTCNEHNAYWHEQDLELLDLLKYFKEKKSKTASKPLIQKKSFGMMASIAWKLLGKIKRLSKINGHSIAYLCGPLVWRSIPRLFAPVKSMEIFWKWPHKPCSLASFIVFFRRRNCPQRMRALSFMHLS